MANGEEVCSITFQACMRVRGGGVIRANRWPRPRPAGRRGKILACCSVDRCGETGKKSSLITVPRP